MTIKLPFFEWKVSKVMALIGILFSLNHETHGQKINDVLFATIDSPPASLSSITTTPSVEVGRQQEADITITGIVRDQSKEPIPGEIGRASCREVEEV